MKRTILVYIAAFVMFSCKQGYHENLTDYELAVNEIHANKTFVDSLCIYPL